MVGPQGPHGSAPCRWTTGVGDVRGAPSGGVQLRRGEGAYSHGNRPVLHPTGKPGAVILIVGPPELCSCAKPRSLGT